MAEGSFSLGPQAPDFRSITRKPFQDDRVLRPK